MRDAPSCYQKLRATSYNVTDRTEDGRFSSVHPPDEEDQISLGYLYNYWHFLSPSLERAVCWRKTVELGIEVRSRVGVGEEAYQR